MNVLIVDDSGVMRSVVIRTLAQAGLKLDKILQASNGAEGLACLKSMRDLGLIVSDRHMPVMDGLCFIKEVRRLPEHARTPILVVSTEGNVDKKDEAERAGANAYVAKPFTQEAVKSALARLFPGGDPTNTGGGR